MKKKFLLITGGTGGHVIPAENFANYLFNKNIECRLIVDKRGKKYISSFKGIAYLVNSSNLSGNFLSKIFGSINLFIGFIKSFFIILFYRPTNVISFGSYASFFPTLSCIILKPFYKIEIFIHEQNSVLGRSNKLLLNYINKLLLNFDISKNINHKYKNKVYVVGLPEKPNFGSNLKKDQDNLFTIVVLGGSQGSEFISKFSVNIIKSIIEEKIINSKFIVQCPEHLIKKISFDLKSIESKIIIKNYFSNIDEILNNASLVISRAGAGSISDLINYRIPSILIPLPSAKDNHQYHNAYQISKNDLGIIIDQNKNEFTRAKNYIYDIYNNKSKLKLINQKFDKIKVKKSNTLIYNLITNEN